MADWLGKALDLFPELEADFERGNLNPMSFWTQLELVLVEAYERHPVDDDLIGRVYDYAAWCFEQPQSETADTDLSSATAVGFVEDLPLHRKVSEDLYRWMSVESFDGFESLFRYHLSEEEYRAFRDEFMLKKKNYSGLPRL